MAERLKLVLPFLINHDQTAYVADRFLGESVRLISDVLEITKSLNIEGFLLTMDIEKAFDSVDHPFLFAVLEQMNIAPEFIDWIKVLINQNESCVFNGGMSTGYFPLTRGSRQGDPISAYLFIIVMEVFFTMVRNNENIQGIDILGFNYLLTAYADDATYIIKNISSAIEIFNTFDKFSDFSGLRLNKPKCECAGIGVKSGVQTALLDIKNINLNEDFIRILGVNFSYNDIIYKEKNVLEVIVKMENLLAIWRWRNLSVAGKISVFKSLAFSKIISISYLSYVPPIIINKIENLQKDFIWSGKTPKVKHSTLISNYEDGGLKDIDVNAKLKSLHLSWIKRLYSPNFHPWKNIPLKLIERYFNQDIFYSNIKIKLPILFPKFYTHIMDSWSDLIQLPLTEESTLLQHIWYNQFIKIGGSPIKKLFPF